MMMDDAELLREIRAYLRYLRTNGLYVSLSYTDRKWMALYPALTELEIHPCPFCDLMKSNAQTARVCFANKRVLLRRAPTERAYACCPYGVEEFVLPVTEGGKPLLYLHATGYAGQCGRGEEAFRFHRQRLVRLVPQLGEAYEREYARLSRAVPEWETVDAALAPLRLMLTVFYERFVSGRDTADHYDILNAAILNFIYENYPLPFSPEEMAERLHYSLPHLRYVFRQKNGVPLSRFLTDFRLRQAAAKLLRAPCTVAEAAYSSGFPDANHFSVLFRQKYGVPPGTYRKQRSAGDRNRISLPDKENNPDFGEKS